MDGKTLVAPATAAGPSTASGGASSGDDPIVQYVVLRRDLWSELGWPLGSVAAQACHAATAALWLHQDDPDVAAYCADLDHMRKVVLEVKGVEQLKNLSQKLTDAGILHKVGTLVSATGRAHVCRHACQGQQSTQGCRIMRRACDPFRHLAARSSGWSSPRTSRPRWPPSRTASRSLGSTSASCSCVRHRSA